MAWLGFWSVVGRCGNREPPRTCERRGVVERIEPKLGRRHHRRDGEHDLELIDRHRVMSREEVDLFHAKKRRASESMLWNHRAEIHPPERRVALPGHRDALAYDFGAIIDAPGNALVYTERAQV